MANPGKTKPKTLLTEGPIGGHIVRMVWPMTLGISASFTVGIVDAFWLGKLSEAALAAAGIAVTINFTVFAVAIGLSSGTVAALSRVVGQGDRVQLRRITTHALILGVLVCALVSMAGVALTPVLAALLGAKDQVHALAVTYLRISFWGLTLMVGPVIFNGILRSLGNSILPSALMISVSVINLLLDPMLIFGWGPFPRMQMAGAAAATVIANALAMAAFFLVMVRREQLIDFARPRWADITSSWLAIAKVGLPAAFSTGVNPFAMNFVVASLARFDTNGDTSVLAAFTAASRIEVLGVIPLFALSASMAPLTGQNAGAGLHHRVREAFRLGFVFCVGWSVLVALVMALYGGAFSAAIIGDNDQAQALARLYLWITPITLWGYGVVMAASAGFNGLSRPMPALIMTVVRSLVLLAPLVWLGTWLTDAPTGAFVGIAVTNVVGGLAVAYWTLSPRLGRIPGGMRASR